MGNTLKDYRIRLELQTKGAETAATQFGAKLKKIFSDARTTVKSYNDQVRKEAIDTATEEIKEVMKVNKVRSDAKKEQVREAKAAGGKETEAVKAAYSEVEAASKRLSKILIDQAASSGNKRVEITKERIQAEENLEIAKFKKFKALADQRLVAAKGDGEKELKIREELATKELALEKRRASFGAQRAKVDRKPSPRGEFSMPGGGNITKLMTDTSEDFSQISEGIKKKSLATVGGLVGGVTGGMYGLMADQAIAALKLVGGAVLDAAKMAQKTNAEFEILSKTINLSYTSNEFQNLRMEIIALERPIGVSVEKMAQLAKQVSSFVPPDKIVETVDSIRALGEVAGGAEQMAASQEAVNKLTTQMGQTVPVADLLATSLTELRGKGVDLGTAQTAISAAFEKGKKAFGDNETAATQATAIYTELAKSGLKTKEVATVTSGSFEELSKAVSDPKMIATITQSLPDGMDATAVGLENGQLDIVKFISSLQKMGPEGAKIAKVVGTDTEKAFGALSNRVAASGQTLDQLAGKFNNVGGNASKFADLFESGAEKIAEKQAMLAEEVELTFGTKMEGALKSGQGMFLDLFDTMKGAGFQNVLRDMTGSLGPLGGMFESIVDMFVDSGVEAKRAVGEFNSAIGVANGFQEMMTGLNELPAPAFLDEIKNSLPNLQKVAPGAAEEIRRLSESANAADPANIEKIKGLMQQISDMKAGEAFNKMIDATKALDEQLTDLTENAGSFWGALVKGVVEYMQYLMPLSFLFEEIFGIDFGDMVKGGFDEMKGSITEQVDVAKSSVEELQKAYDDAAKSGDQKARLAAAKELEVARSKQFDLMKQESQLEDTALKNIQTKLKMREDEAKLSGQAFDKQTALKQLLDSTQATLGVNDEIYKRIVEKTKDLATSTEETSSWWGAVGKAIAEGNEGLESAVDLTEEQLKLAVKNSQELDKYLDTLKGVGATMEEQAEMEKAELRAKIEKNKIIEVALESQLAAIDAAIVAQNNSVDAENQRIKAAHILAEKQEEIQKIISGQQAEATAVELVQAGNLNAAREKIAGQLDSIRKANAGLEKAIGDVDKKVAEDKKKKTTDTDKKQADEAKKIEDDANKKKKEQFDKEQALLDFQLDQDMKRFQTEQKLQDEREKAEKERIELEKALAKEIKNLQKAISEKSSAEVAKSLDEIEKLVSQFRPPLESFKREMTLFGEQTGVVVKNVAETLETAKQGLLEAEEKLAGMRDKGKSGLGKGVTPMEKLETRKKSTEEIDSLISTAQKYVNIMQEATEEEKTQVEWRAKSGEFMSVELGNFDRLLKNLQQVNTTTGGTYDKAISKIKALRNDLEQEGIAHNDIYANLQANVKAYKAQELAVEAANRSVEALKKTTKDATAIVLEAKDFEGTVRIVKSYYNELTKINELFTQAEQAGLAGEMTKSNALIEEAVSRSNELLKSSGDAIKVARNSLAQGEKGFDNLTKSQKGTLETTKNLNDATQTLAVSIDKKRNATEKDGKVIVDNGDKLNALIKVYNDHKAQLEALGISVDSIVARQRDAEQATSDRWKSAWAMAKEVHKKELEALELEITAIEEKAKIEDRPLSDAENKRLALLGKVQEKTTGEGADMLSATEKAVQSSLNMIQTWMPIIEELPGKIKAAGDAIDEMAFKKGPMGGVTEAIIQGAQLTQEIGQALMSSPSKTMKLIGSVMVGAALITKAIAKITQFFLKDKKTQVETAEKHAATEEKINRVMATRLEISQLLTDAGNTQLDQAHEQLKMQQRELDFLMNQSRYAKQYIKQTDEMIAQGLIILDQKKQANESDLTKAEDLLESGSRGDIGDFLREKKIDTSGGNKKAIREYIDTLKAAEIELNAQYESGNDVLKRRAEIRRLEMESVEQEINLLRFRMKLEGDQLSLLKKIGTERRAALVKALNEAGIMVDMTDSAKQLNDAIKRFAADEDSVISDHIIGLHTAWQEMNVEIAEYQNGMEAVGAAIDDLAEKHRTAFDNERKLLELRTSARVLLSKMPGETDDALAKRTDEEFEVRLLALLRRRVEELKNERDTMEDAGASADKLLENEFTRLEVETEIWNMLHKQNSELDKEDAVLNEMIRSRQKMLELSRPGGLSPAEKATIAAKTAEMVAHLTAIGKSPAEIQAFLDSLPQFAEGGTTGAGGMTMTHPDEYIMRAAAVDKYGVNFFDQLNKMQMPTNSLGDSPAGRILNRGIQEQNSAVRSLASTINIALYQNNTITGSGAKEIVAGLSGLTEDSLYSMVNRGYESGKITQRVRQ